MSLAKLGIRVGYHNFRVCANCLSYEMIISGWNIDLSLSSKTNLVCIKSLTLLVQFLA